MEMSNHRLHIYHLRVQAVFRSLKAVKMSSDWVETKAILSEVEQLFNRDDDIRYIYDVKKMAKEIDDHCLSYLSETKDIIKSKKLLVSRLGSI